MKKSKRIKLDTYNCFVTVTITDKVKSVMNGIYKKFNKKDQFTIEVEGVVVSFDIDQYYIIIDKEYLNYNTISHELFHAVVKVTEEREIVDEESQAWLMGYLAQIVYSFILDSGFKISR